MMIETNYGARDYSLGDRVRNAYCSVAEQLNTLYDYASRLMQMYSRDSSLMLIGADGRQYTVGDFEMPDVFYRGNQKKKSKAEIRLRKEKEWVCKGGKGTNEIKSKKPKHRKKKKKKRRRRSSLLV